MSKIKKELKDGDKCPYCFTIIHKEEIRCRGAISRGEPNPTILVFLCLHPGDLCCNCGNPCWSFF
jgi:hypothetical protein